MIEIKFNKILFFILFSLILIVFIGGVNAANVNLENNNEILNFDVNDEIISVEDSSPVLNDDGAVAGDFQSLKKLIDESGENSVINLTQDYTFTLGVDDNITRGIVIDKSNVTINGNGFTINALEKTRMFQINGDNVTLSNLNFIGGSTPNDNNITEGETFWHGGAVIWRGDYGYVDNCVFADNVNNNGDAGALWVMGNYHTIVNSIFDNNLALNEGGGVYCEAKCATVLNTTFRFNTVTYHNGAGMFIESDNATIGNCIFEYNWAGNHGALYDYAVNTRIYNCTFSNNFAKFSGAALLSYGVNSTLDGCTFIENIESEMDGAAIDWSSRDGRIINSVFIGNEGYKNCGAIFIGHNNNLIENCTFIANTARLSGGAIYNWDGDYCTVNNCTFINNTAGLDGGAFCCWGLNGTFSNNIIINSTAQNDAGAIQWIGNNGTVINSTITCSSAKRNGGAIQWIGNNGTVINSKITDSITSHNGGGIYWAGNNESVSDINIFYRLMEYGMGNNGSVISTIITDNKAYNNGGAVYWNGTNGKISKSVIGNNIADYYGGAIFLNNNITLEDSYILDNKARAVIVNADNNFVLVGSNNYINAIYANSDDCNIDFNNIVYWNGDFVNSDEVDPIKTQKEAGIPITLEIYDANGSLIDNITNLTDDDGLFRYDDSKLTDGIYNFKAYHADDNFYAAAKTEGKFQIKHEINVVAPDVVKYFGGTERFMVFVTDYQGKTVSNKSVVININGVSYNRTTDDNGISSIALRLTAGTYNVTSVVDNKTVDSTVTIKTTVNGTDITKVFRNGTQYYATFLDSEGNYLKEGTSVRFNINGVMYDRKVEGDKGLARLNIKLNAGEYIITAINTVTGEETSNIITVISRLVENEDVVKIYGSSTPYTVKAIGDNGKAVGAGETVRFNINGVFYERTTNASGVAQLNINLIPGRYIVTAEYLGCAVSNNVTVTKSS